MARRCTRCLIEWPDEMGYCPHDGTPLMHTVEQAGDWDAALSSVEGLRARIPAAKEGDELGAYTLTKKIGEGGMGTVFRATHKLLGREVAIKVLLPDFVDRSDIVHRFFKEAEAVNRIRHPNIVDVTDFVEAKDHPPYLVMEFLQGETLATHIHAHAPLLPPVAGDIAKEVCDAMAAVHDLGIVHRDLKPDNVFLVEGVDGGLKTKLLDFGIAKFMATEEAFLKTRTGELIGTPEYMAPEQIRGVEVDHRADIYAMGVILFEMLTGRQPFTGLLTELLSRHLQEPPQSPSEVVSDREPRIPRAVDEVVLSCLAKEREDRMQTMRQLKDALDWSMEDTKTELVVLSDVPPTPKARWLWAVSGVALLCLVILGVWAIGFRGSGSRSSKEKAGGGSAMAEPRPAEAHGRSPAARRVKLHSIPAQAAVYRKADGEYVGRTPAEVTVVRGQARTFVVRKIGHQDANVTLDFDSASPVNVRLAKRGALADTRGVKVRKGSRPAVVRKAGRKRKRTRLKAADYGTVNPFKKR